MPRRLPFLFIERTRSMISHAVHILAGNCYRSNTRDYGTAIHLFTVPGAFVPSSHAAGLCTDIEITPFESPNPYHTLGRFAGEDGGEKPLCEPSGCQICVEVRSMRLVKWGQICVSKLLRRYHVEIKPAGLNRWTIGRSRVARRTIGQ